LINRLKEVLKFPTDHCRLVTDYCTPPLPFPNVESGFGNDVNEISASLLNFTQGSLTYCENKVKSKSKLEFESFGMKIF
jgi:hypothetical protein